MRTAKLSSRRAVILLAAMAAMGLLPLACGGNKPAEPPPSSPTSSASASSSVPSPPPPPSPSASTVSAADAGVAPVASGGADAGPLANVLTTDPTQVVAILAAAASAAPATLLPPGSIPSDPVEAGLKALAAKHAKGMKPEGDLAKGDLKQGDHLSMMVSLQPGRCYALVGFSPKGNVEDLDLRLLAPPFFTLISGEDTTDDNTPVIGKDPAPMCPVLPVPLAYKVDIHAQKGAGKAGVQLYSRPAK